MKTLFLQVSGSSIAEDVDTVSQVISDALKNVPQDTSDVGGWVGVITVVVIGGFGLFRYFKAKYKKD